MSLWLTGIGVSRGIAIGRVQKLHGGDLEIPEYSLPPSDIDGEVVRFYGAQRRAKEQLREVRSKIPVGTPGDIAAFIDTHLLMMDDRSITEATVSHIRSQRCNAEAALRRARDALRLELARHLAAYDGITLLVTHDHEEAFTVADRLAVMRYIEPFETNAGALGVNIRSIPEANARNQAFATYAASEQVMQAIREHPDEVPLARDFVHRFLQPAGKLIGDYARLARRNVPSAQAMLREVFDRRRR